MSLLSHCVCVNLKSHNDRWCDLQKWIASYHICTIYKYFPYFKRVQCSVNIFVSAILRLVNSSMFESTGNIQEAKIISNPYINIYIELLGSL